MEYNNMTLSTVHKNYAFAAEVALDATRHHQYWPMHDLLFRHQAQWAALPSPRAYLLALGDSAGLDRAGMTRCVTSGAPAPVVRADAERAPRSGATSTPTLYIQGALLQVAGPVT